MAKSKVIIDYRTDEQAINSLSQSGFEIIKTMPLQSLYEQVKGHADMQIHVTDEYIICAPSAYHYYKEILPEKRIISGESVLNAKYPYDIAYNTCKVGKYAICNKAYTDKRIIEYYEKNNFEIVDVKQGYAKCNICVVNDSSVITSDNGIYKALAGKKLNVLKISEGNISLYDMNGFIGGASGLLADNLLAFNGDITTHPDSEQIIQFCKSEGVDVVSLSVGCLKDIGSIITV